MHGPKLLKALWKRYKQFRTVKQKLTKINFRSLAECFLETYMLYHIPKDLLVFFILGRRFAPIDTYQELTVDAAAL